MDTAKVATCSVGTGGCSCRSSGLAAVCSVFHPLFRPIRFCASECVAPSEACLFGRMSVFNATTPEPEMDRYTLRRSGSALITSMYSTVYVEYDVSAA